MKKQLITAFLVVAAMTATQAQVVYRDLTPDKTVNGWDAYIFHLKYDSLSTSQSDGVFYLWMHPGEVVLNAFSAAQVLADNSGNPRALNNGTIIDAAGNWVQPSYHTLNGGNGIGNWIGVSDKYLALRFKEGGQWYYGWTRLDIDATPTYFTLKDMAYNSTAGAAIQAGQGQSTGFEKAPQQALRVLQSNRQLIISSGITTQNIQITLTDMSGRVVKTVSVADAQPVDIASLADGVYVLQCQSGPALHTQKILLR